MTKKPKKSAKQKERDDLFHLRNGYPADFEMKGVTVLSQNPQPKRDHEKGVETHDQRHG